jgi:hypothetical protein
MRIQLFLLGLVLVALILTGCTTRETADQLSNQDTIQSFRQSNVSFVTTTETPVPSNDRLPCNESWGTQGTWEKRGNLSGMTSPTACFDYGEDTWFELSHGPVTIERNDPSGSQQFYLVKTNMTLTNRGLVPIKVVYATAVLKDDVSDGCFLREGFFTCGLIFFGTMDKDQDQWLNPGESETRPLNVTIISSKSLESLSSRKFLLEGAFDNKWRAPNGSIFGWTGGRRDWLIDLNQTGTPVES